MRPRNLAAIFIFFISGKLFACNIILPKIIIKDSQLKSSNLKFHHGCSLNFKDKLNQFISQNTGNFSALQISKYTGISPDFFEGSMSIEVHNLNDFLNKKLKLPKNKSFFGSRFIGLKKFISLSKNDELRIKCDQCEQTLGEKNVKLIKTNNKTNSTIWLKTILAFEVEALFPKEVMHPTTDALSSFSFIKRKTSSTYPQNLITDIKKIKFLQLRRMLDPNKPIKKDDFIQHNLVTAGRHTNVIFKSKGINLSLKALPLEYGKFGQDIRLRNPKSNKIIIGKVTDFNTVLVEL